MDPTQVLFPRDGSAPSAAPLTPGEQFLSLVSDPFKTQMQGQAVLSAFGLSVGATLIIALIFCFVRPYNTVVYAPRLRHADEKHAPPQLSKSPWAWLGPVMQTKEDLLVEKVGMDAALFIRFTGMCRDIFLVLTLVGCGILVPVYLRGSQQNQNSKSIDAFTKLTPQFLVGSSYWGIVVAEWAINVILIIFLWWNYRAVTRLRRRYFESAEYQTALHARTLIVTDIPNQLRSDEGVVRIVDGVKNNTALPRATIGRNMKGLPDLIDEHEELVRKLEAILAKYLKKPDNLPPNRPQCKPSKKDTEYSQGQKVDAIDYLTARIQRLEKEIHRTRASIDKRDAMPYGFASYDSVEDAHGVAFSARNKHPNGTSIELAPRPSDLIWKNLALTPKGRKARAFANNMWITLLTLLWIAPNALIAVFLANLNNLALVWKSFDTQLHAHPKTWAVVQGVASPLITTLFYIILPKLFRRLAIQAGDTTKTSRDRHVLSKLYFFFVFNNLIVFSVFGAVWQFAAAIIAAGQQNKNVLEAIKEGQVSNKIFIALCNVSPFWTSYLLFRSPSAAVDLAQIANLAWGSFSRRFLSPTPRQVIEASAPAPFDYASYYNYFLFYSTVTICFATIQPIVLPVTALYFCLDASLKKYLIMYVFSTKTESGGRFWRVLFNRMLVAAVLSNFVVALMVYAQRDPIGKDWVVMLLIVAPLPLVNLLFKLYCKRAFDRRCAYYAKATAAASDGFAHDNPTAGGVGDDASSRRSGSVAVRFGHPAMHKPLMTPMVHARAQHLLGKIYTGRMNDDDDVEYDVDDDDTASFGASDHADAYSMHSMGKRGRQGGGLKLFGRREKKPKKGPFEFVSDAQLDRAEFHAREGGDGDGDAYGMAEDALSRAAMPAPRHALPHQRTGSLPRMPGSGLAQQQQQAGLLKPMPGPADVFGRGGRATDVRLVSGAAPMGSRATTPRSNDEAWL
jgi:hypothetical protein